MTNVRDDPGGGRLPRPRTGPGPWPGEAATIITMAIAIISTPAAPVRHVVLACSRLTTAVISATPFPLVRPLFPVPLR